jgi:hypothetical protein
VRGSPHFDDLFGIPHADSYVGQPRLLLASTAEGWTVPRWLHPARYGRTARELDDPFWPLAVQREVRRQLGIDVSVLHADLHDERDPASGDRRTVMVLENLSPGWTPPAGMSWAGRAEIERLVLAPWVPRAALLAWFAEAERGVASGGISNGRPPWQRPGWLATATAWARQQARACGLNVTGPAEQLGTKVGRYLMRVPTTGGAAYFKAIPPMYARELGLLRMLSADAPERVPDGLAFNTGRGWHLTRDHGGRPLTEVFDLSIWERALDALGQVQVRYVGRDGDLVKARCTDLRPETMVGQIESLLADRAALLVGQAGGLTDDDLAVLRPLAPSLRAACGRLAASGVPSTLVHGDFTPANVSVVDGGPVFFDWCEATLSHPFFSAVRFLLSARWQGRAVRDDPDLYARLRDAYLAPWTPFAPMRHLTETWELASALQPLAYALTYWHLLHALAASGQRADVWERRGVVAASLRRLLDEYARMGRTGG